MINENNTLLEEWYCHQQLRRVLSLVSCETGIEKELLLSCMEPSVRTEARKCLNKGKFAVIKGGATVYPLSPLIARGLNIEQKHIEDFLWRMYLALEKALADLKPPKDVNSMAKTLGGWIQSLRRISLTESEKIKVYRTQQILHELTMPRIGNTEHLQSEIRIWMCTIERVYVKYFGDNRKAEFEQFHAAKGKGICMIFEKALDTVTLDQDVKETILSLLLEYFERGLMFHNMVDAGEKMLKLQVQRKASAFEIAETHYSLSNGYLAIWCSDRDPKWKAKSDFHNQESHRYFDYDELEEENDCV